MSDTVTVKVDPPIGSILERVRARLTGGTKKGILKAAEFAAGELRRQVRDTFGQRTGGLGRSFRATLIDDGEGISAGAFSDAVQAKILDQGGTIHPKSVKFLAIPVSPKAKRTVGLWPRHWPKGVLRFLKDPRGGRLVEVSKGGRLTLHYLLRKSVTIKARHYIEAAVPAVREAVREILAEAARG